MTVTDAVILLFAVIIGGLLLPLSSGKKTVLWVALIIASVLTFVSGSMLYVRGLFD